MEEMDAFDAFSESEDVSRTNSVFLQEVDISDGVNNEISDQIEYPCIIVDNIKTKEEVTFFLKRKCNQAKALPFYLAFNGYVKRIGLFELTLENLLSIRSIANYRLRLYRTASESRVIDLDDPEQLIKFITF